jgi:prepilin-type N-terminal cleavage/methylation domain-containing protein
MGCGKPDSRPRLRGFSLIEVLIGIVVVVFALYGVLDLVAVNQRLSLRAHRRAVAVELARAKMAEIQAAGFDAVTALWAKAPGGATQPFVLPSDPAEFKPPYKADAFRWQARFDRVEEHPEIINVEVRVLWYPTTKAPTAQILENSVSVGGFLVKK